MSLEAEITGPIFQLAVEGIRAEKSILEGRLMVPQIHESLNGIIDTYATRTLDGLFLHDEKGWTKVSLYMSPENGADEVMVNLLRHFRSEDKRVDVFVEGLDTTFHVSPDKCELRSRKTVPQRGQSSFESMRTPAGSFTPADPFFDMREAYLDEVQHIQDFVEILGDQSKIGRIKSMSPSV